MSVASTHDPSFLEFLAEDVIVTIVPKFSRNEPYRLMTGSYGPFIPNLPTDVPLWFALHLKRNQKCQIRPPTWMDVDRLKAVREEERASQAFSKVLPESFVEVR